MRGKADWWDGRVKGRRRRRCKTPPEERDRKRRWYWDNRDELLAARRAKRNENIESARNSAKLYRRDNAAAINEQRRRRYWGPDHAQIVGKRRAARLADPRLPGLRQKACDREKSRREKDPAAYRAYQKKQYRKHRRKRLAKRKAQYWGPNRGEILAKRRDYEDRNRELLRLAKAGIAAAATRRTRKEPHRPATKDEIAAAAQQLRRDQPNITWREITRIVDPDAYAVNETAAMASVRLAVSYRKKKLKTAQQTPEKSS